MEEKEIEESLVKTGELLSKIEENNWNKEELEKNSHERGGGNRGQGKVIVAATGCSYRQKSFGWTF